MCDLDRYGEMLPGLLVNGDGLASLEGILLGFGLVDRNTNLHCRVGADTQDVPFALLFR